MRKRHKKNSIAVCLFIWLCCNFLFGFRFSFPDIFWVFLFEFFNIFFYLPSPSSLTHSLFFLQSFFFCLFGRTGLSSLFWKDQLFSYPETQSGQTVQANPPFIQREKERHTNQDPTVTEGERKETEHSWEAPGRKDRPQCTHRHRQQGQG